MSNFEKQKKYYTKSEVEKYIQDLLGKSEIIVLEQKDKIFALSLKNGKLEREVAELTRREKLLSKTLTDATKSFGDSIEAKKQQIIDDSAMLRKFVFKWQILFEEGFTKSKSKEFEKDMEDIIDHITTTASENEMTTKSNIGMVKKATKESKDSKDDELDLQQRYELVLKKYEEQKKKQAKVPFKEGTFDIEEALNPTKSLDEIMKDIFNKNK